MGVKADDADLYVRETVFGDFFDAVSEGVPQTTALLASNYIANDLVNIVRDTKNRDTDFQPVMPISVQNFKEIIAMLEAKEISSRSAKDLLVICTKEAGTAREIAKNKGLLSSKDPAMMGVALDKVIADNPAVVADFRAGKAAALEFLVGQGMKALKGAGDPAILRELLKSKMGG